MSGGGPHVSSSLKVVSLEKMNEHTALTIRVEAEAGIAA